MVTFIVAWINQFVIFSDVHYQWIFMLHQSGFTSSDMFAIDEKSTRTYLDSLTLSRLSSLGPLSLVSHAWQVMLQLPWAAGWIWIWKPHPSILVGTRKVDFTDALNITFSPKKILETPTFILYTLYHTKYYT